MSVTTVYETDVVTIKITSGPGMLLKGSSDFSRQVQISRGETVYLRNDGAAGRTTIQGYLSGLPITQSPISVDFYGKATKFVASANAVTASGYNLPFRALSHSDTVTAGNDILSFIATDAMGLAVSSPSQNVAGVFYVNTSDTKVVRSTSSATDNKATCTISSSSSEAAAGKYYCDMYVIDSGTVTLTVMDSTTVSSSTYTSNAITVRIAGPAVAGTLGFAKLGATCTPSLATTTTFEPGEPVKMCITAKDGLGRNAGQTSTSGAAHNPFNWSIPAEDLAQNKPFWIGGLVVSTTGGLTTGTISLTTVRQFLDDNSIFVNGSLTVGVYMPTTSGDINIKGATGDTSVATSTNYRAVTATLKVTGGAAQAAADAAAAAANAASAAAVAAAKAAQDAAVAEAQAAFDAASEAIDAANAATDAANLAAEAADAATVAAEEARDAADAATAAVEELATQVASLMAALRAQITTLANTVVKIAKKVKA